MTYKPKKSVQDVRKQAPLHLARLLYAVCLKGSYRMPNCSKIRFTSLGKP